MGDVGEAQNCMAMTITDTFQLDKFLNVSFERIEGSSKFMYKSSQRLHKESNMLEFSVFNFN